MFVVGLAASFAVLVWWFTTGLILFLDGLAPATFRRSLAGATALLAAAIVGLNHCAGDTSIAGAYCAFSCTVLVWGWLEMSFLMGFITGPRKHACAETCGGARHFLHALQAIIYNELATLTGGALVAAISLEGPNKVGLWTFAVLWTMRLSAKLNLFFGVPNSGEKLLPPHLKYLKGFFKRRAMNFLFPLSISASTLAVGVLAQRCLSADSPAQAAGFALVTSLLALAVVEHWFMVLPLPTEKLWNWGLKSRLVRPAASSRPAGLIKAPSEC